MKQFIAPWAVPLSQNAAKYAIVDFGQAANAWGEYRQRVKQGIVLIDGWAKRREDEQGFRADNGPGTVKVDGRVMILPKTGRLAMMEGLRFGGSIREATIDRAAGVWCACFCIYDEQEPPPVKDGPTVGVSAMATCSDGMVVENPKEPPRALKQLRRLDQTIARSRNVHGRHSQSHRQELLQARRRRLHARVVNVRNDQHHKATAAIAKSADQVVETLNMAGMMRNRRMARTAADAGMSGFLPKLEYKCLWYGAQCVKADRWFASSRLCSHCGWKNDDLALSERA